jgi:UDP-N-acetylglucosamine 2-epimerase
VEAGFVKVVGVDKHGILAAIERTLKDAGDLPGISPYGDGAAARRIVDIVGDEARD